MKRQGYSEPTTGPGSPGEPWLPPSFVRRFESWSTTEWAVFEWGAGWSSLWLASRCAQVFSVESDRAWYERIGDEARRRGLFNLTLILSESMPHYVEVIDLIDGLFDCVLVDGIERNACVERAIPHVGRVLVFDNASRGEFEPAREMLRATGWPLRVEQWTPGHPRHDQADTWYYSRPEFAAGYVGLPPSPHEAW